MKKQGVIEAVHDDDLIDFLESIGELDKITNGQVKCIYCEDVISTENLQSIIPSKGEVVYCCNKVMCQEKLYQRESIDAKL